MPILNPVGKMIALELADEVLDLLARHPDGITAKMIAAHCGCTVKQAEGVIGYLASMNFGKWIRRPDRSPGYFVPLDWEAPAYDLTQKQRATLDYLIGLMDDSAMVTASFRDVRKGAMLSSGGIVAHLEALVRKGYLRIVTPGRGTRKTLFEVFPHGDGPQRW